ncbi:MAG: glycosyltransferase family 4 protein [Planctomycetota bacterium]
MSPSVVLLVDPRDEIGGDSLVHLELIRHLDRSRIRPIVLCHDRGPLPARYLELEDTDAWSIDCGTRSKRQPRSGLAGWTSWLRSAGFSLRAFREAWRLARQHEVRLIHSSNTRRGAALGQALSRALRVPWLMHGHSVIGTSAVDRHFARAADKIACVSRVTRDAYRRVDVPEDRLELIENAVAASRMVPRLGGAELRLRLGIPEAATVAGWVGRLTPSKGPEVFLEAAAIVARRHPGLHFVLVGDAEIFDANRDYESELLRLTRDLGLCERVSFTGFLEDVASAYDAFDISVVTTRDEGFGLVGVESMLAGLPIVSSRIGAIPDILDHERTALLVTPGAPRAVADALTRLIENPEEARRLGDAARQSAQERFAPERQARSFEALYERMMEASLESMSAAR